MSPALTLIRNEPVLRAADRAIALREARRARPEHLSQTAAAALLGLRVRDYTGLESGRLTLSAEDWARAMEVIRG